MSDYRYENEYRLKYKDTALKDIMIFRSGPMPENYIKGMDFGDNARALFEYALQAGMNRKYELVWIVKDPREWNGKYKSYENVIFISYEDADSQEKSKRDRFFRYLCLAKYLFMTDTYGFALGSRKDQIRVMLWHGCGFKARLGSARNEDHYEYMTVTGEEYARTYARVFGLRKEQMLVTGYPKVDQIFHPVLEWKAQLGVPEADKYIFWLPTFRNTDTAGMERHNHTKPKGELGLPMVESAEQMGRIDDLLAKTGAVLVIKLHPFQSRAMINEISGYSNVCLIENSALIEKDIQINQMLGYADALISDYSSVAVDYLVLDRPVAFTLDDMETYGKERGFFWQDVKPHLPGKEIYNFNEFFGFISDVAAGKDPGARKRHSICGEMQKYHDDKNSERVFRALGIDL